MNFNSKKIKIITLIPILVLIIGTSAFFIFNDKNNSKNQVAPLPEVAQEDEINLNPATEEDIQRAEQNKENLSKRIDQENQKPQEPEAGTKLETKPTITYAGQYGNNVEIGGFASVFEDGGKCVANFTKDSSSFSREVSAVKGAQSVDCPVISVASTDFPTKGTWTVKLSYESAKYQGTSENKNFEVK